MEHQIIRELYRFTQISLQLAIHSFAITPPPHCRSLCSDRRTGWALDDHLLPEPVIESENGMSQDVEPSFD
uniref:Uncharacterized protein n=1 Tax=Angiostrongylus cantonensis TaxID=6313 RepID=A0A0K0DDQ1_ANGCA